MKFNIFWFRRDLRLNDNKGLYQALKQDLPVMPIFIFDSEILDKLSNKSDARVTYIHNALESINKQLIEIGSGLNVFYGEPGKIFEKILSEHEVHAIFSNKDYEPYALQRDEKIKKIHPNFIQFKDHVIFEEKEIVKSDGNPYTVFTPYSKKWLENLNSESFASFPSENLLENLLKIKSPRIVNLNEIGFSISEITFPPKVVSESLVKNYDQTRNYPSIQGTSRLGIHFRFGTISIREKARKAIKLNKVYLNELIWRDFYSMILFNYPRVANECFRQEYDQIEWINNTDHFESWCKGLTGYPLVDAGMRELNSTGYMHNRVRMVVASFLTKHLLIDWRWGADYFAEKLLDFDLASNSGGWQWAAGCGTDAAPYFRIFNPIAQQEKFDSDFIYIKKWIPEYNSPDYPKPIVDHKIARDKCLEVYKKALKP